MEALAAAAPAQTLMALMVLISFMQTVGLGQRRLAAARVDLAHPPTATAERLAVAVVAAGAATQTPRGTQTTKAAVAAEAATMAAAAVAPKRVKVTAAVVAGGLATIAMP